MSDSVVRNNPEAKRYETAVGEETAVLEYILAGSNIVLHHTEVPKSLEGQGIGSKLAKFALEDAKAREISVIPMCPFVASYIKRHPEYRILVFGYTPPEA